jgi:hypothetical protein
MLFTNRILNLNTKLEWILIQPGLEDTKNGKNIPNNNKMYQLALKYNKWTDIKREKIYQKIYQNIPKREKYTK